MKRFAYIIALLGAVLSNSCDKTDDDNGPGTDPIIKPVWERYTHAQQMLLKDAVKSFKVTFPVPEEEDLVLTDVTASFDANGNLTAYDATGVDFESQSQNARTRNNWITPLSYSYTYDSQGRMSTASVHQLNEPSVVYTITYGDHNVYIVAPFALGPISPLMLKGVTKIEATGYTLVSDGKTTTSKAEVAGWPRTIQESGWPLTDELPSVGTTKAYTNNGGEKGEMIWEEKSQYTYEEKWLTKLDIDRTTADEDSQRTEIKYSLKWPNSPISKTGYAGKATEPEFVIEYTYAENGLPTAARYTTGLYFDPAFDQHYTAYDNKNNWTGSIRKVEDVNVTLTRAIIYY